MRVRHLAAKFLVVSFCALLLGIHLPGNSAKANVVGPGMQNFNPSSSGLDFVTVHSSQTLEPGMFNFGLFFNYAVNSLPVYDETIDWQEKIWRVNDTLLMSDFSFGVGLTENLELGFAYPRLWMQDIDETLPSGQFVGPGNTDLRFTAKYRFFRRKYSGMAFILSTNIDTIGDNPYSGDSAGPVINFEWAGDWRIKKWVTGLNLGYRYYDAGSPIPGAFIQPMDDTVIASAAASYYLEGIDAKVIGELFGSHRVAGTEAIAPNREATNVEAILGMKHDITDNFAFHWGAGSSVIFGPATPHWRLYTGINWAGRLWGGDDEEPEKVVVVKKKVAKVTEEEKEEVPPDVPEKPRNIKKLKAKRGETIVRLRGIQFKYDKYDAFVPNAHKTLGLLVKYLQRPPLFKKVIIEGHTDSMGGDDYNLTLSQKRAEHIKKVLISDFGLDGNKLEAIGYGEKRPIADNGNHQGRQKNRRVDFRVQR